MTFNSNLKRKILNLQVINDYFLFGLLVLFIFLIRTPALLNADIYYSEWDSVTRYYEGIRSYDSYLEALTFRRTAWLPLQFYLIKCFDYFSLSINSFLWCVNVFYAISFGFILRTYQLFSPPLINQCVFALFTLALSFVPLVYYLSMTALSEPLFISLFFITTYCLLNSIKNKKSIYPFIFFLSVNNLLRYEAWVLSFVLGLYWLSLNLTKKKIIILSSLLFAPMFSLIKNWIISDDPLLFLTFTSNDATSFYNKENSNYLDLLFAVTSHAIYFLAPVLPLIWLKKRNLKNVFCWCLFAVELLLSLPVLLMRVEPSQRYVIPFMGVAFIHFLLLFPVEKLGAKKLLLCLLSLLFIVKFQIENWDRVKRENYKPLVYNSFNDAVRVISKLDLSTGKKIFIADIGWVRKLLRVKLPKHNSTNFFNPYDIDSVCQKLPEECFQVYKKQGVFDNLSVKYLAFFNVNTDLSYDIVLKRKELTNFKVIYKNPSIVLFERFQRK